MKCPAGHECPNLTDEEVANLSAEIMRLEYEVAQLREAFKAADFRATDYSQRIMAAAAEMDEYGAYGLADVTRIRAALKLGDD